MASDRAFEPIVAESSSGSSTAGVSPGQTPNVESPSHPGHPDYIAPDHNPYDQHRQFEPLHGPLETTITHDRVRDSTNYHDTGFEQIHNHTSPRADVEVRPGDRAELQRIASAGTLSRVNTRASRAGPALSRRDTYADVGLEDPALDPNSPDFVSALIRASRPKMRR